MIQLKVSPQYRAALLALNEGKSVRRATWPEDQHLLKNDTQISHLAGGSSTGAWRGPSEEEAEATDWLII